MSKPAARKQKKTPNSRTRGKATVLTVPTVPPQLQIVTVEVAKLQPYERNPRKNDQAVARMVASIQEFGFRVPVLAKSDGSVIDGHLRLKAAQSLNLTAVPVILCDDWTDAQVKAFRLLVNRSVNWAECDTGLLKLEMADLQALEFDLGLTGFDAPEIEALFKDDVLASAEAGDAPVPELPAEPVTRPGDVWLLGKHRLMCGDSTSVTAVQQLMVSDRAMLLATDPPYGVDFAGAKYNPRAKQWKGIANDKLQGGDLSEFLVEFLNAWLPYVDDASAFYCWTAAMEEGAAAAAIRQVGLHIQSQIIWKKNCLVLGQADYQWMHENCWYAFWKGKHHRWYGERDKTTVWEVSKVANGAYVHPMQKPTELYAIPMRHHTQRGDVVAEPFCGSGSQIIAAEELNRRCYAMELSPAYVDVAVKRWQDFTKQKATLEGDGRRFDEIGQR